VRVLCGCKVRNMVTSSLENGLLVEFQGTHCPQEGTIFLFAIATCKNVPPTISASLNLKMGQTCAKFIIKLASHNFNFNRKTLRICFTTLELFFSQRVQRT